MTSHVSNWFPSASLFLHDVIMDLPFFFLLTFFFWGLFILYIYIYIYLRNRIGHQKNVYALNCNDWVVTATCWTHKPTPPCIFCFVFFFHFLFLKPSSTGIQMEKYIHMPMEDKLSPPSPENFQSELFLHMPIIFNSHFCVCVVKMKPKQKCNKVRKKVE